MYLKSVWSSKIGDRIPFKKCVLMWYFCIFAKFLEKIQVGIQFSKFSIK